MDLWGKGFFFNWVKEKGLSLQFDCHFKEFHQKKKERLVEVSLLGLEQLDCQ